MLPAEMPKKTLQPNRHNANDCFPTLQLGSVQTDCTIPWFTTRDATGFLQSGVASVYSTKHSTKTASVRRIVDHSLTTAHRTLPFGTKVRVTHSKSGKSVIVTITDRGPFLRGRIIDLTPAASRLLGISGLAPVRIAPGI